MIRVADYIAKYIELQEIKHVFMLSGGGSIYLDDGIAKNENIIPVLVRHEAVAPMAAKAYSQLTKKPGIVFVTTGPGGTNAISGLVECWVDSIPVIIISGQVEKNNSTFIYGSKYKSLGTQDLNILDIVKPITKATYFVDNPNNIKSILDKAFFTALSGRQGPVWIDIPLDIQKSEIDETSLSNTDICNNIYDIQLNFQYILNEIINAKNPIIVVGQGVKTSNMEKELEVLINKLKIPVIFSRLGQDSISHFNDYVVGHGGIKCHSNVNKFLKESDLILSLGSSLAYPFISNYQSNNCKIIMVDIDETSFDKPHLKNVTKVYCNLNRFIPEFLLYLDNINFKIEDNEDLVEYIKSFKSFDFNKNTNPLDLYDFIYRLNLLSNSNHIFVSDAGSSYYITGQLLTFDKGQKEITSGTFASMGNALGLSIGAAFVDSKKQILTVVGDGSIEQNIQELKTISEYNLNIKIFVINNGGYVSIRNTQDAVCGGRHIGSDNKVLDFSNIAIAFDLSYYLINDYNCVNNDIKSIMRSSDPMLIEVICNPNQKIL